MSRILAPLALTLALGCGPKAPPEAPPAEPTPEAAEAEAPPEAPPEPPPPPPPPSPNADLAVTLTQVDGSVREGRVERVERTLGWFGDRGWSDSPNHLAVEMVQDGQMADIPWEDIATVEIRYGDLSAAACEYDTSVQPIRYMCTLDSESHATTHDGERWSVTDRHRWRFTFEDGEEAEFHLFRLPARLQDEAQRGTSFTENPEMYPKLHDALEARLPSAPPRIELATP